MKRFLITSSIILGLLCVVGVLTYYFATTGGGKINVSQKISDTDQSNFVQQVLPDTRTATPNGGLVPRGNTPTPQPPTPEPILETSSTTDATATSSEPVATTTPDGAQVASTSPAI